MVAVPTIELSNGLKMPALGLGTWTPEPEDVVEVVKSAIDRGYRHFDTALVYQNERYVGKAIRDKIAEGVVRREDIFVASKLWNTYHRPDLVAKALDKTLANLGLDYVDLYLIHWPIAFKAAADGVEDCGKEIRDLASLMAHPEFFPVDESGALALDEDSDLVDTWHEMEKCVDSGRVKSIGVSNFNSRQLERVLESARIKPVTNQVEVHPYLSQDRLIDFCRKRGIVVTAYGPLGTQIPMEKLPRPTSHPKVEEMARQIGKTPAQVILRYLVQKNTVPIPKTSNLERLAENISVFDFALTPEQMSAMESLNTNERLCVIPGTEKHKEYPFAAEF